MPKNLLVLIALSFSSISFIYSQCPDPSLMITSAVPTDADCGDNGTITVSATGGSGQYEYRAIGLTTTSWGDPSAISGLSAITGGSEYTVEVRDKVSNCVTSFGPVNVPSDYVDMSALMGVFMQPNCTGETGDVQLSVDGGKSAFTYTIISGPTSAPANTDGSFNGLAEGTYRFAVEDACGVVRTLDADIIAPDTGDPNIRSIAKTFNSTTCEIEWRFRPTLGGTAPYLYQVCDNMGNSLSGAPSTSDVISLPAPTSVTNYVFKKIDACGRSTSLPVRQGTSAGAQIEQMCDGDNVTWDVTAYPAIRFFPVTYVLTTRPGGVEIVTVTSTTDERQFLASLTEPGNYQINTIDACMNTARQNITVSDNRAPMTATLLNPVPSRCFEGFGMAEFNLPSSERSLIEGGIFQITASDNASLTLPYDLPTAFRSSGATRLDNIPTGTHTISFVDANGCNSTTLNITIEDVLEFDLQTTLIPGCASSSIEAVLTDNGDSRITIYRLLDDQGDVISSNSDGVFPNLPDGDYTVQTVNQRTSNPLCSYTFNEDITIAANSLPNLAGSRGIICDPMSTYFSVLAVSADRGVPPYSYQIKPAGSDVSMYSALQNSNQFTDLAEGTYDVRVFDQCNQSAVSVITIAQLSPIQVSVSGLACVGESIDLTADFLQDATYNWTTPTGQTSTDQAINFTGLQAEDFGVYTVTTVLSGCVEQITEYTLVQDNSCAALPIDLLEFKADFVAEDKVSITWTTGQEINNDYFEIMRSKNGFEWEVIHSVSGAVNSNEKISYQAFDYIDSKDAIYYRLRQVDLDGMHSYSKVQRIKARPDHEDIRMSTNVVRSGQFLDVFTGNNRTLNSVALFDTQGKTLINKSINQQNGSFSIEIPTLPSGIYFIHILGQDFAKTEKIFIQ